MMQLQPGDYLRDITVKDINAVQGAGTFRYHGHACYLLNRDVPRLTLRPGLQIEKLVCVRHEMERNQFQCALPRCFSRQVQELYSNDKGGIRPYIHDRYRDAWLDRWRQTAESPEAIRCGRVQVKKKFSLPGRSWMAAYHENWEMPVPVAAPFEAMAGTYCFFPAPMQRGRKQSKSYAVTGQPVYRDDGRALPLCDALRVRLKCTIGSTKLPESLPVDIHLHPPVDPKKFHFSVWKHCFSPKKVNPERKYWQCLFKAMGLTNIPGPADIKQIFSDCTANHQNTNCEPCDINRYRKVHDRIRTYLNESIKISVTFLQDRITNKTEGTQITMEELFPSVFGVQIVLQDLLPWAKSCGNSQHRCVYRGILYFDRIEAQGVLHLSLVTQYNTRSRRPKIVLGKNILTGKIYHVQTST